MKTRLILLAVISLLSYNGIAFFKDAYPAVFSMNAKNLLNNKRKVAAADADIMPSYKALLKEGEKALTFAPVSVMEKEHIPPSGDKHDFMSLAPYHWPDPSKPNGLPYMRKDGQTNPEVATYKDKEYLPQLCDKIYTLSLAYYFSDDKRYADHAAKLIRTWFLNPETKMNPNLNFAQAIKGQNTGRGAGMIDGRHLIKVIEGIGLLQGYKQWTPADQQGMQAWFSDFSTWMHTSPNGIDELDAPNNHGDWYDALRLSIALFINDTPQAKKIVESAMARLDKQMDNNGRLPLEMERTTSLHYSVFAMTAFFKIAHMADKVGVDFWNYNSPGGKSLKKGFDSLAPYLCKEKDWDGQQIKEFKFEEGIELLKDAQAKFNFKKGNPCVENIVGEKAQRLIINLTN